MTEPRTVWFSIKILHSGGRRVTTSGEIWKIHMTGKKEWSRGEVGWTCAKDFYDTVAKKDSKAEYGVLEGELMYRIHLLAAAGELISFSAEKWE